jgi:hypothetical protein
MQAVKWIYWPPASGLGIWRNAEKYCPSPAMAIEAIMSGKLPGTFIKMPVMNIAGRQNWYWNNYLPMNRRVAIKKLISMH